MQECAVYYEVSTQGATISRQEQGATQLLAGSGLSQIGTETAQQNQVRSRECQLKERY